MDLGRRFEDLPLVGWGATSYVFEVTQFIIVKVPKPDSESRCQFRNEVDILSILSRHPPCPQLISCFLYTDNGIFLEYMRDICLSLHIQNNHTRNSATMVVTKVNKYEPRPLRITWMHDLACGAAFLESLGLAHGDLRPENILLDRNCLKLADFDCTAPIGSPLVVCVYPYGRILGSEAGADSGSAGDLGARTEQFALGSLYYLINYGFEVYGDCCFGADPSGRDHGPIVLDLLQKMVFPVLGRDEVIDKIIEKCWHGGYQTIADLAKDTALLCDGSDGTSSVDSLGESSGDSSSANSSSVSLGVDSSSVESLGVDSSSVDSSKDFASKKKLCEDLVARGILEALGSIDPYKRSRSIEHRWAS